MGVISRAQKDPCAFLGEGTYGSVVKVRIPTAGNDPALYSELESASLGYLAGLKIAVKIQVRGSSTGGKVLEEGQKMWQLKGSPHVVECYGGLSGVVEGEDGIKVELDCLLMECAENGTVKHWVDKQVVVPDDWILSREEFLQMNPSNFISIGDGKRDVVALMSSIIGLLAYLQAKGMTHSDFKPGNFLVDGMGCLKGADWGSSGPMGCVPAPGTLAYDPPEGVDVGVQGERDMWSAGCTATELMTELAGNVETFSTDVVTLGEDGFWRFVLCKGRDGSGGVLADQPELENLLRRMISIDQKSRITAAEAMHHPYFVKHSGGDLEGFWKKVFAGEGPRLTVV
jgi:serine/threonine protein kinase